MKRKCKFCFSILELKKSVCPVCHISADKTGELSEEERRLVNFCKGFRTTAFVFEFAGASIFLHGIIRAIATF